MTIYQRKQDNKWVYIFGRTLQNKIIAGTYEEIKAVSDKIRFAEKVRKTLAALAQVVRELDEERSLWNDRAYSEGDTNAITDDDLPETGVTAMQLTTAMLLAEQMGNFMSASEVAPGDYGVIINQLRNDI